MTALDAVAEGEALEGGLGAGEMGELGGDLGGEELGGGTEMPAGDAGGGDESPLLAVPPGSRNVPTNKSLEPQAKGKKHFPKKVDRRPAGARSRSYVAHGGQQKASSGIRNVMPGYSDLKGMTTMQGLGAGIYEYEDPTYNRSEEAEERKMLQLNESIRTLIEDLETNTPTEQITNED